MEASLNVKSECINSFCFDFKNTCNDSTIMIVSVALSTLTALGFAFALTASMGIAALVGVAVGLASGAIGCIARHILKTDQPVKADETIISDITHIPPTSLSAEKRELNTVDPESDVDEFGPLNSSSSESISSSCLNVVPESIENVRQVKEHEVRNPILVTVRNFVGKELLLYISIEDEVAELKRTISQQTDIPVDKLRVIFAGKELEDGKCGDYDIRKGSVIHYLKRRS